jgi:hypothetical protein
MQVVRQWMARRQMSTLAFALPTAAFVVVGCPARLFRGVLGARCGGGRRRRCDSDEG